MPCVCRSAHRARRFERCGAMAPRLAGNPGAAANHGVIAARTAVTRQPLRRSDMALVVISGAQTLGACAGSVIATAPGATRHRLDRGVEIIIRASPCREPGPYRRLFRRWRRCSRNRPAPASPTSPPAASRKGVPVQVRQRAPATRRQPESAGFCFKRRCRRRLRRALASPMASRSNVPFAPHR
jgi:hypothetical protein